MKLLSIVLVVLICALLLISANPARSQGLTCPTPLNVSFAELEVLKAEHGVNRLIDPFEQGFASHHLNTANLSISDDNTEWLVGGVHAVPLWDYHYHLVYRDVNAKFVGDVWFATLPNKPNVYFYFVMPVEQEDHPNCPREYTADGSPVIDPATGKPIVGYGSAPKLAIDNLFKPRK